MALAPMVGSDEAEDETALEDGVEIELETPDNEKEDNPNVEDQLEEAASDGGIDGDETKPGKPDETVQQKYDRFMEANPDARDIHGKKTEKRIGRMTWETKEAERLRDEAIAHAQRTQEENTQLRQNRTEQDGEFINEHKSRLESQLAEAKRKHQQATNLNDSEGMTEATQEIAALANKIENANITEARYNRAKDDPLPAEKPYVAPAPAAKPQVHPKAEAWAKDNEWFGEDEELTKSALAIHKQLVTEDGYIPSTNAYYNQLDERMKKNYPDSDHFKTEEDKVAPQLEEPEAIVAGGSGNTVIRRKPVKIRLKASQVQLAKRLGITPAQYAKSLEDYNKAK